MRRFKGDDGVSGGLPRGEQFGALAGFGRQKAVEIEVWLGDARHAQRAHHGRRAHHRHGRVARFAHPRHQFCPGVAHGGRAGVGNLGDDLPAPERGYDFARHLLFVVFAHGNELGLDAVGRQELGGHARVFGADEVCFLQHGKGAQGDVGKVADGGGNDVERAGGEGVLGFLEVFLHEKAA